MAEGIAARSRQAILDAAIPLIAADRGIALTEVARRLGIGRTSLYRYFSDRRTLLAEVRVEGARRILASFVAARPHEGSGISALTRICEHLFDLGPVLSLLLADNPLITDGDLAEPEVVKAAGAAEFDSAPIQLVVARGHRDGTIDAALPSDWIETYVWMTLAAGHLYAQHSTSRHAALDLVLRSVHRSLAPRS